MNMKKLFCFIIFLPFVGLSQESRPGNPSYTGENKLIVLRFVPQDKSGKVFLVGSKVADIDFNKNAKLLSVVMLTDKQEEVLQLDQNGSYYEIKRAKTFPQSYKLVFKTKIQGKIEDLQLKVDSRKP